MIPPYEFRVETLIAEGRTSREALEEVKAWLRNSHLPQLSDESVALFLLACKDEVKAAEDTISAYFAIKQGAPELFDDRDVDDDELKKFTQVFYSSSLPVRMADNVVVHFMQLHDPNYRHLEQNAAMKMFFMLMDVSQMRDPPDEMVVVVDVKEVGFMHLTILKPRFLKKFVDFLQDAMPLRLRSMHFINSNYFFEKIVAMLRMFMRSELLNNVRTYPPGFDMKKFQEEWVPASCLPEEYGGHLPKMEELNRVTIEQLRRMKSFFKAEEDLRRARE